MKKSLLLFVVLLVSTGLFAQRPQQPRVVKVQGQVHEYLTKRAAQGKLKRPPLKLRLPGDTIAHIDPSSINCWVGCPTTSAIDTAYLLVKWTDGKRIDGDSILVWGYRWDATKGGYPVSKYSVDMIRAIANVDKRFSVLLQQTGGSYNYTVGGIGYNFDTCERIPLQFELDSAALNPNITFKYTGSPSCTTNGQLVVPVSPASLVSAAITVADNTGIIEHPSSANYGYPAYDYDYWVLTAPANTDYEWQAGWYKGYWTFYNAQGINGTWSVSDLGVSSRVLTNQSIDGFVFNAHPEIWPPVADMGGDYTYNNCSCTPSKANSKTNSKVNTKTKRK